MATNTVDSWFRDSGTSEGAKKAAQTRAQGGHGTLPSQLPLTGGSYGRYGPDIKEGVNEGPTRRRPAPEPYRGYDRSSFRDFLSSDKFVPKHKGKGPGGGQFTGTGGGGGGTTKPSTERRKAAEHKSLQKQLHPDRFRKQKPSAAAQVAANLLAKAKEQGKAYGETAFGSPHEVEHILREGLGNTNSPMRVKASQLVARNIPKLVKGILVDTP